MAPKLPMHNNLMFATSDRSLWYIVQCYSGFESGVIEGIKHSAHLEGITSDFQEFYVPSLVVQTYAKGKKVDKQKAMYPGYILIKMKMNEKSWMVVNKTNRVIGFAGNKLSPKSLTEREYEDIVKNVTINAEKGQSGIFAYSIGDKIKILDGSFKSFIGTVTFVSMEKENMSAVVKIFDREMDIELNWNQVEKLSS